VAGAPTYRVVVTPVRRSARVASALLAAAGLALAGCGGSTGGTASASGHTHSAPASVSAAKGKYDGVNLATPYHRPSFTLTDTTGASYDFTTVTKGRPTLLFFGYTHCPDVCPTTMADISVALRGLDPATVKQVQVVFVTTDPARDTPAVLGQWLGHFDADLPAKFVGLTGTQQQLEQAQLSAGVPVAQDDGQTHSALLLLYGADDKAHVAFDAGNTPADMAHDLRLVAAAS
jgi:protein SCO1/2